jgi:hypothetical protein
LTGAEGAWRGDVVEESGAGEIRGGQGEATGLPVWVRLRFTHEPLRVVVRQDGREVILAEASGRAEGGDVEERGVLMGTVDEPVELLVEATWPEGTGLTALGVELEPDGLVNRRGTMWAEGGTATELLSFSWK